MKTIFSKHLFKAIALCLVLALNACGTIEPEVKPEDKPEKEKEEEKKDPEPQTPEETVFPTKGEHNYLVILVETPDVKFSIPNPKQAFGDMLNKEGYSDYGGTGSARDYFIEQSRSAFKPGFDVFGPVCVNMEMSNFTVGRGLTKLGAARLFAMACDQLDTTVDFSKYDTDNNGIIDNVFFYYAGYNSADGPDEAIWPHAGKVEYKEWTFDGKKFTDYACTSELKGASGCDMARIGNFCHEFAHVLGLPDFYDTEMVSNAGPWDFSLMHNGCYNNDGNTPPSLNCEERMMLGWLGSIPEIPCPTAGFKLKPVSENCGALIPTDNPGEYYYLEYRDGKGWDKYLPEGLVIYHVDKSENVVNGKTAEFRWRRLDNINCSPEHPCFDLIKASEEVSVFGAGINSYQPVCWSGNSLPFRIDNVAFESSTLTLDITATE